MYAALRYANPSAISKSCFLGSPALGDCASDRVDVASNFPNATQAAMPLKLFSRSRRSRVIVGAIVAQLAANVKYALRISRYFWLVHGFFDETKRAFP